MAKITATFERYFQHKPYEGEKIILTVEDDAGNRDPVEAVAALHRRLSQIGDEVTAERLRAPDPRKSPLPGDDEEVPF